MNFTAIIMRILWRFAPVVWLDRAVAGLISWAVDLLMIEEERWWLDVDRKYAHWFGGWLAVIEARIDELIEARAYQLLRWRWPTREVPPHSPVLGVRSCEDGYLRLLSIIARYHDVERLAHRRAEKLLRLREAAPINLIPDHRPAEAQPPAPLCLAISAIVRVFASAFSAQRIRAPP